MVYPARSIIMKGDAYRKVQLMCGGSCLGLICITKFIPKLRPVKIRKNIKV